MGREEQRGFKVAALGEIAIRCRDMDAMEAFYADVIGLERLARRDRGIVFFRISDGFNGHTAVLALFDKESGRPELHPRGEAPQTGAKSSLHHIALTITHAEQEAAMQWYDSLNQPYTVQEFDWIGWRGVFTMDPDGNTVELVAATGKGPKP
jgi:catechol 2,3-dioxygenase-like lactoylglutathione lyase family enzyme